MAFTGAKHSRVVRTKGSHHIMRHPDYPERETTVPVHAGDVKPGTLRAIEKRGSPTKRIHPERHTMQYPAFVTPDDGSLIVTFPDLPGCITQVDPGQDFDEVTSEALDLWLEDVLGNRQVPPTPKRHRAPAGSSVRPVRVSATLAAGVLIRQARAAAGLSQTELAERLGGSQQQVANLELPDGDVKLSTLERAAAALGLTLEVSFIPRAA